MEALTTLAAYLLPELWLAFAGFAILTIDFSLRRLPKRQLGYTAATAMGITAFLVPMQGWLAVTAQRIPSQLGQFLNFCLTPDLYAIYFKFVIVVGMLIVILASLDYVERHLPEVGGEFYALLCFVTFSMFFMVSTIELITLFLALEFTSIASYVLAAFSRTNPRSAEAGIKYFLTGAAATAVTLYGMSLIYAFAGTTNLYAILNKAAGGQTQQPALLLAAIVMVLASLGFKIAMVPFQAWAPDTYEGAPTPITAFLAVASKGAALALLARFLLIGFGWNHVLWRPTIALASAVTMTVGNLFAIPQKNIKRLLAYSSIAHVGYMLVALASVGQHDLLVLAGREAWRATDMVLPGLLLYVLAYTFATGGAFIVVLMVSHAINSDNIDDYAGLAQRMPYAAWSLVIFFLSLIGVPPLVGFFGKALVFAGAIYNNMGWLALLGVLNSVVSLYYYFEVIRRMFFMPPRMEIPVKTTPNLEAALLLALAGTIILGILPGPALEWIRDSLRGILMIAM